MGFKLGDVSPVVGMATGEGMTGDLIRQGVGGVLPMMIARNAYEGKEEEKKRKEAEAAAAVPAGTVPASGMKKGGKVKVSSASKRADGIAVKGKTRGRIV